MTDGELFVEEKVGIVKIHDSRIFLEEHAFMDFIVPSQFTNLGLDYVWSFIVIRIKFG